MPSSRLHTEWLSLIEVSGPFLSVQVLERVFPQGLDARNPDHVRVLRLAFDEWEDDRDSDAPRPAIHREWIRLVLKEMQAVLALATDEEPADLVKEKLLRLWRFISEPLRQALESRKNERTEDLKKLIQDRADKEVSDITAILNELRQAIQGQLDGPYYRKNYIPGFAPAEQEQFERNVDALRRRWTEIPGEIEKVTEAIRARFADPQPRMFPVAAMFVVPRRMGNV